MPAHRAVAPRRGCPLPEGARMHSRRYDLLKYGRSIKGVKPVRRERAFSEAAAAERAFREREGQG